jgi:hypothetical protein
MQMRPAHFDLCHQKHWIMNLLPEINKRQHKNTVRIETAQQGSVIISQYNDMHFDACLGTK